MKAKPQLKKSPTHVLDKHFITAILYRDSASAVQKYNPEPLYAQRPLELWVMPVDGDKAYKGELDYLSDTAIVFKNKKGKKKREATGLPTEVDVFHYQRIKTVAVRRRDRQRKLALWGTLGGFATGALVGWLNFEDTPPCDPSSIDGIPCDPSLSTPQSRWEKAILTGAAGSGIGMLTGGLVGSVKVRIPIEGRKDAYNAAIPKLERLYLKKR